ncbi:MAG TPA: response regulator, partial [Candidatus Marinimicrobia bacterium]|nr:response regulator [Candidatus Neomarinimicrobiota bacterium]
MKKRILIVDDEQALLDSLKRSLRDLGKEFDIYTANDGVKAFKILEKSKIELIITDIFMPDKDGLELIREVRQKYPSIKIITMSGGGNRGGVNYLKFAETFGSSYQLNKP